MRSEVLPSEETETGAEVVGADGADDGVPGVHEVWAADIAEEAEGGVMGVCGEDAADELVGRDRVCGIRIHEVWEEYLLEVAVSSEFAERGGGEVGFGELGFDQQGAELEVDLCGIYEVALEGDAGLEAEGGLEAAVYTEEGGERCGRENAWVAEDVHE